MSDRTLISVVTDLLRTGLTVEQQILVNELALTVADLQRQSDGETLTRVYERERKRVYREGLRENVPDCPGHVPDKRKEPKENNILNISQGESERDLSRTVPDKFDEFWSIYPRRIGKGEARKAWKNALKRGAKPDEIIAGAKRYRESNPDPQFTKHPGPWLNADRWLDEYPRAQVVSGPWKPFKPELPDPVKPPAQERERQLARLKAKDAPPHERTQG